MVNNQPIGILDSGIGAMTVLKQALKKMPSEKFIFICDQKNLPYGSKSKDKIINLTRKMVEFLIKKNVKAIIFACNTATAQALDELKTEFDVPMIGVIQAGSQAAVSSKVNKVGLIATTSTINSKRYLREINQINPHIELIDEATPDLVPMIESGNFSQNVLNKNLQYFEDKNIEGLILGCTHYPIIQDQIENYFKNTVKVIDPSKQVVDNLMIILKDNNLIGNNVQQVDFYTTGDNLKLNLFIKKVLDIDYSNASTVNLEK